MPRHTPARHHFLPRLLLKGFASRSDGDKVFIWQFRKEAPAREVSTRDVGVSRYFHGRTSDIEDKLSSRESAHAGLVRALRNGRLEGGDSPVIADFVATLIVRTKNVRQAMADLGAEMLARFGDALSDDHNLPALNKTLTDSILQQPQIRLLLGQLPEQQQRLLLDVGLSRAGVPNPALLLRTLFEYVKPQIDIHKASTDAQLRALREDDALAKRRDELARLNWSVAVHPESTFILGDVGPVARFDGHSDLQAPMRPGTMRAIYLPVSHQSLLVGHPSSVTNQIDPEELNWAAAELSRDLFVARQDGVRERDYAVGLGRRPDLFDESEIAEGLRGLFD